MRKLRILSSAIALLLVSAFALAGQSDQTDPFIGTWKLNVAKSDFGSEPVLKSSTITFTADGKVIVEVVNAQGKSTKYSYPASDGKEVAIDGMEGATYQPPIAVTRITLEKSLGEGVV